MLLCVWRGGWGGGVVCVCGGGGGDEGGYSQRGLLNKIIDCRV